MKASVRGPDVEFGPVKYRIHSYPTNFIGAPVKKKHTRVHLHAGKKVEVGSPDVAPAVVAKMNPSGDAAPSGPNTFSPHVDTALSAGKPGGGRFLHLPEKNSNFRYFNSFDIFLRESFISAFASY